MEKAIGKGQFPVYQLKEKSTNQTYAIKILQIQETDTEKEKEILNEASLLSQFNQHKSFVSFKGLTKNIKPMKNSNLKNIEYGIIMDLMQTSLEEEIKTRIKTQNFFPLSEIKKFINQTYEGFIFMEHKKIAHRDIKPANILIDLDGNYKIADLGVSKVVCDLTGTMVGTLNYMSIELMDGYLKNEDCTHCNFICSDVFSYGLTLLKMITLENIAGVNLKDGEEKKEKLLLKIRKIYPEASQELILFLKKLLEIDPNKRKGFEYNFIYMQCFNDENESEFDIKKWNLIFISFDDDNDGFINYSEWKELAEQETINTDLISDVIFIK